MRKLTILFAVVAATILLVPAAAMAGGVTGPAFYVDGELYRTVNTPTDISNTGAPDHSFDTIYAISSQPYNVATAAPGNPDYNGGRWKVHALQVTNLEAADSNDSGDIDSFAEIEVALANGWAVDLGIVKYFVCPVIPLRGNSG